MKKATLIAKAGSTAKLARLLNISTQAISKWDEEVPLLRVYQVREKRPEWFRSEVEETTTGAAEACH